MSDFRKFCWGLFVGLGAGAALQNHGVWRVPNGIDPAAAIIMVGLAVGALTVNIFARETVK